MDVASALVALVLSRFIPYPVLHQTPLSDLNAPYRNGLYLIDFQVTTSFVHKVRFQDSPAFSRRENADKYAGVLAVVG